ncbi:MAG: nucleoid occlusion factor SlmA [Magnetococcales bacterium]|nr:nucleoid occlusion factor SlmA [Magnetococcales bacterium]
MIVSQEAPPKTKANKTDRRRRPGRKVEILQAVMTLLEKGNDKVTTAALAAEVGLSEAALYRHFSGKSAIFKALTDYVEEHLLKPAYQLQEGKDSPLQQLNRLYHYHLLFFAEHPGLCRVFLVEGVVSKEETQQMIRVVSEYKKRVKKLLSLGQERQEISTQLDLDAVANLFVGMIQAATLRFVMSGFKHSPVDEIDSSWQLFMLAVTE